MSRVAAVPPVASRGRNVYVLKQRYRAVTAAHDFNGMTKYTSGNGPLAFLRRRELALINWVWPKIDDPESAERYLLIARWAVMLAALLQIVPFLTAEGFPEQIHPELILNPRTLPILFFYGVIYAVGYKGSRVMAVASVVLVLDSVVFARFGWEQGIFAQLGRDYGPIELVVSVYVFRTFVVGARAAHAHQRFSNWAQQWKEMEK